MLQIKNSFSDVKLALEETVQTIDLATENDGDMQIAFAEIRGGIVQIIRKLNGRLLIAEDAETPPQQTSEPLTKMFGREFKQIAQAERPAGEII